MSIKIFLSFILSVCFLGLQAAQYTPVPSSAGKQRVEHFNDLVGVWRDQKKLNPSTKDVPLVRSVPIGQDNKKLLEKKGGDRS